MKYIIVLILSVISLSIAEDFDECMRLHNFACVDSVYSTLVTKTTNATIDSANSEKSILKNIVDSIIRNNRKTTYYISPSNYEISVVKEVKTKPSNKKNGVLINVIPVLVTIDSIPCESMEIPNKICLDSMMAVKYFQPFLSEEKRVYKSTDSIQIKSWEKFRHLIEFTPLHWGGYSIESIPCIESIVKISKLKYEINYRTKWSSGETLQILINKGKYKVISHNNWIE